MHPRRDLEPEVGQTESQVTKSGLFFFFLSLGGGESEREKRNDERAQREKKNLSSLFLISHQ